MHHPLLKALMPILFLLTTHVQAVVFDFQELTDTANGAISGEWADGTSFGPANSGERAFNYFDWTQSGITLTASASYAGTGTYSDSYGTAYSEGDDLKAWAYLDQGHAGLGVCSLGLKSDGKGSNQCNPGGDDNVTINEILQITFDQDVSIDFTQTDFRNAGHTLFDPTLFISLDSGSTWSLMDPSATLISDRFFFKTMDNHNQFYIDALSVVAQPSEVSEPNAFALFALTLAIFSLRRKRGA